MVLSEYMPLLLCDAAANGKNDRITHLLDRVSATRTATHTQPSTLITA